MTTFYHKHRSTIFACAAVSTVLLTFGSSAQASGKSPEDVYEGRSNNLDILPDGAINTAPIRLVVSFSLDHAPNSPEAQAFLKTWYDSITALPDDVDLQIHTQVAPGAFQYAVSLTFNNWEEYRVYESRPEFLEYYYEHWKPHVTKAEERVYLLNAPPGE